MVPPPGPHAAVRPPLPDAAAPPRRDKVLLFLLLVLNLGSAWTTVLGARQVLPSPLAELLGLTVQGMLFLLLAGWAARHAALRKWLVVGVFAAFSIYTSFFTYYRTLAGDAVAAAGLDQAHQAHAAFVAAVYQPAVSEALRLEEEAAALQALSAEEADRGVTTGAVGFGPRAREYAAQARARQTEAATLRRELERLAPAFELELAALSADQLYAADLAAWQAAPDTWKAGTPAPARAAYVDLEQQVDLLTPFYKVQRRELPALIALLIACLVDGIAILLGTAIEGQRRPVVQSVSQGAARLVEEAKDGAAHVRAAWERPGLPRPVILPPAPAEPAFVLLRLRGRGSDFLGALYAAIHPESGAVDLPALLHHDNESFRVGARLLADRLRAPELGWLVVRDGWWGVPPGRYDALTGWLAEQLRQAVEDEEAEAAPGDGERVLRLSLPRAA